jgi:hypothetical protein
MRAFVSAARGRTGSLTAARMSLESHLLAFAAEESRANNSVIDMSEYRAGLERAIKASASI